MKVSLEWLRQFVPDAPDAARVGDALTLGGLPVEHIDHRTDGDDVLDVEVTSNRSDCLSIVGVAREVAALLGLKFVDPVDAPIAATGDAAVSVTIEATDRCPHYTARVIRGIAVAPSPPWMQRRLDAVGVRPINNLVDVTNYVLFETGHPLHVFDLGQVGGNRVVIRNAREGESIVTLDGKEQKLATTMLVIADESKPIALAGVMGGELSGVTFRTTDVLVESARFHPMTIRKTARSLALASDSSYRFERGIDPTLTRRASDRACELILKTAGGKVDGPRVEAGAEGFAPRTIDLRFTSMVRVLGIAFEKALVVETLNTLGFGVEDVVSEASTPTLRVTVPSHRLDVRIEVDLIEEVARVIGYDKIPTRDEVPVRLTQREPARVAAGVIAAQLNAAGYFEALTFSFVSDALADRFKHAEAAKLHKVESATRRTDAQLRPSILPNLLESVRHNETVGVERAKLFEMASTFWIGGDGKSVERRSLGIVGDADYRALRGAVEATLKRLDARRSIAVVPAERTGFGRGACGEVRWGDESVGYVGVVDRAVAEQLGLRGLPAIAEIWLAPLLAGHRPVPQLDPLQKFPAVRRDLSLLVPEAIRYEQIEGVVRELKLDALEAVDFVTTYRGKPLDAGSKSVTFTLAFRKPDGTLTSAEVDERVARVVESAGTKLGSSLRA